VVVNNARGEQQRAVVVAIGDTGEQWCLRPPVTPLVGQQVRFLLNFLFYFIELLLHFLNLFINFSFFSFCCSKQKWINNYNIRK
jgi:hypothetical protein